MKNFEHDYEWWYAWLPSTRIGMNDGRIEIINGRRFVGTAVARFEDCLSDSREDPLQCLAQTKVISVSHSVEAARIVDGGVRVSIRCIDFRYLDPRETSFDMETSVKPFIEASCPHCGHRIAIRLEVRAWIERDPVNK